jgi:hypothetical protein
VGFVLQGMRPAAAQAAECWQGAVLITYNIPHFLFKKIGIVFWHRESSEKVLEIQE